MTGWSEDICRVCGAHLGEGIEALHVGICETCSAAPNIIQRIADAMQNDYENLDAQSQRLLYLYDGTDDAGRKLLDDALACVCGYTLKTLRQAQKS